MSSVSEALLQVAIDKHGKALDTIEPIRMAMIKKLAAAIENADIDPNDSDGEHLEAQLGVFSTLSTILTHHEAGRLNAAKMAAKQKETDINDKASEMVAAALKLIQRSPTKVEGGLNLTQDQLGQLDDDIARRAGKECKPISSHELELVGETGTTTIPPDEVEK